MSAPFPSPAEHCPALPALECCAGHTGVPTAFISLCGFTALLSTAVWKARALAA